MTCDGILFCFSTLLESINGFRDILGVLGIRHEMGGSLFDLSKLTSIRLGIGRSRWGHGRRGGGVRAGAQALRRQEDKALHPSPHAAEALVPSWQESRRMYSLFAECAK